MTCPFLLPENFEKEPFQWIEFFFSHDDLPGYRHGLKSWLRSSLKKDHFSNERMLFLYGQFTQLIQAAYEIVVKNLHYQPVSPYTKMDRIFKDWMLRSQANTLADGQTYAQDYEVRLLESKYRQNPFAYLEEELNFEKVKKIRMELLDWLFAGISVHDTIDHSESCTAYELYEKLLKITEAFYLIVMRSDQAN